MKNLILCLVLLFAAFGAMGQSAPNPAQAATEKLTQLYGLTAKQQAEVLKIQERKFRNLADIETLKQTDPNGYARKVQSIALGNNASFERIFTAEQQQVLRQQQLQLRERKAVAFKEMKTAGKSQQEIDRKMLELELEAL